MTYKFTISTVFIINPDLRFEYFYFLIYLIYVILCGGAIYHLFTRKLKKDNEIKVNNLLILIVTIVVASLTIMASFFTQDTLIELNNLTLFLIVNFYAIIVSIAGICICFMNSSNTKLLEENATLDLLLKKDEQRYKIAKINAEQINIKYHDLKQKIRDNKIAQEEVDEIEQEGRIYESLHYTGNKALDVVLIEKNLLCQKNKIQLWAMADGNLISFMKSFHIYSIFGNLIDNSIEYLAKVENPSLKVIRLNISQKRESIIISIENYCEKEPIMKDGLPITSKADKENHGFGMKSILSIVNKYNGHLKIEYKDQTFKVIIVFPLNVNPQ